jgi:hypothetical protein
VGELVNKDEAGMAREGLVQVEFGEDDAFVWDIFPGEDFETFQERFRFSAAVGFNDAHHHVPALFFPLAGGLQHGVGFPHARVGAEKKLEPSTAGGFLLGLDAF